MQSSTALGATGRHDCARGPVRLEDAPNIALELSGGHTIYTQGIASHPASTTCLRRPSALRDPPSAVLSVSSIPVLASFVKC